MVRWVYPFPQVLSGSCTVGIGMLRNGCCLMAPLRLLGLPRNRKRHVAEVDACTDEPARIGERVALLTSWRCFQIVSKDSHATRYPNYLKLLVSF